VDGLHASSFVRKDIDTQTSSFPANCLIFVYTNSTNVDHIRSDDGTNTFHFVHDASIGTAGNSTLCAGSVSTSGNIIAAGDIIVNGNRICSDGTISFLNGNSANPINTGCILTSNSYADASNVPACGIWSKGVICSNNCLRAPFVYSEGQSCAATCMVTPTVKGTGSVYVNGVILQESTDRPGLLEINCSDLNGWTGTQVNHSGQLWSLMGNASTFGLYDDTNGGWAWCYSKNGSNVLYSNGVVRLCTSSIGGCFVGVGCSTTCHRSPYICATSAIRTTGTGFRICGGTGCGCAVDWVASSDCRYKCNIIPYECGLEKINYLKPVCYEWKETHEEDIGFIAQEVEKVEPVLVQGNEKDGYGLKYDKFSAMAVKAIQELSEKVDKLQKEIDELKNKK
jgi:hypothetical protein